MVTNGTEILIKPPMQSQWAHTAAYGMIYFWSAQKPFWGGSWIHLQLKGPSGRRNYGNPLPSEPYVPGWGCRGHRGGIAELSHAEWPLDTGAAEKLKEKHLQSGPSAEASFINWNNNNNDRGMTRLVAAGWDSWALCCFDYPDIQLVGCLYGHTCGREDKHSWANLVPHLASAQASGLILSSDGSYGHPPSHIQKGAAVFNDNLLQERLWQFCWCLLL